MKTTVTVGAILFIWISIPTFMTTLAIISTDIVKGTCAPWGAHINRAVERMVIPLTMTVSYPVPLALMVVCYSRIVYALRNKVR